MKSKLTYGIIFALTILIAWIWLSNRTPKSSDGIPAVDQIVSSQLAPPSPKDGDGITHMGKYYPPPPNGYPTPDGTPPNYLTWEQVLNPVRGPGRSYTREEIKAQLKKGASAKFKILVIDSTRKPVPDVAVEVRFIATPSNSTTHKTTSDNDGLCSFEGVTMGNVVLNASKAGYYTTEHNHYFFVANAAYNCIKDGRWQPWDATLELVLKEKRDPAPLHVKFHRDIIFPKKRIPYGFDCAVGDLVEPDGKGKVADLIFTCTAENRSSRNYTDELCVQTVNGGGLIRGTQDKWSELKSPYTSPETGYVPEMVFRLSKTPDKILEDSVLRQGEYLIFETYSRGEQPCVGKIYGSMLFGEDYRNPERVGTGFLYFFNPIPGDRRIESDPDKNLFGKPSWNNELQP